MLSSYALFKVFDWLCESSGHESIRGVAAKAGVGVSTAKRCCDYLFSKEIVVRNQIGRLYQYRLNVDNVVARHLKIARTLARIQDAELVKEISSRNPQITSVVLYGSAAAGTDNPTSDLDLLIVSRSLCKLHDIKSERKLNREVSYIVCTRSEWRKKSIHEKPFYENVILGGIALFGELPVVT